MNILIVEDEYNLADMIRDFFVGEGDSADICTDGILGFTKAASDEYDAIILDVMLPGMDGFEILKRLRKDAHKVPVLMLTAKSSLEDKLEGLSGGAQDYLTKPFEIEELYVRVKLLGSKGSFKENEKGTKDDRASSNILRYGNTVLDGASRDLSCVISGKKILLPAKEYSLAELFMRNPGQILSKEQITEHIWGYESNAEYNHEEVYISFLRKKLKFIGADVAIETVRGAGYRLICEKE